jgi:hypothetical protein
MADYTAGHAVNSAQYEQSRQVVERSHKRTSTIGHIEHRIEYVDPLGAGAEFDAGVGGILLGLHRHEFTKEVRETLLRNSAWVRSTAGWIEYAVQTRDSNLVEALGEILNRR